MLEIWLKVFSPDNLRFIWSGMWLTLCLSVGVVLLSIPLGAILGLLRNYEKFVLGRIAAVYIEVFRNTPLLLWMFSGAGRRLQPACARRHRADAVYGVGGCGNFSGRTQLGCQGAV
ncbi:hypothetical protein SDC9_112992 [bioreactor metagenome]|uniref:ABC transmembrane type-1 domain-containing protein n=1 Tax=bioreactor metagenome TaxID=1076179 RepID=A0A645BL59_9ZZZZ